MGIDLKKIDFDKLNKRATKDLIKILKSKGIPNIVYCEKEKSDGFLFTTSYGSFWFQCETDDIKEE